MVKDTGDILRDATGKESVSDAGIKKDSFRDTGNAVEDSEMFIAVVEYTTCHLFPSDLYIYIFTLNHHHISHHPKQPTHGCPQPYLPTALLRTSFPYPPAFASPFLVCGREALT
jgi:hypothetical protein